VKLSLVRERDVDYEERVSFPGTAADIIRALTRGDADESFFVLALDIKNRVNHIYLAAKGGSAMMAIRMADLFRAALLANAHGIIVGHNHPSGDLTPSQEDIELTKRIAEGCKILGLRFLDSIVVTDKSFSQIETWGDIEKKTEEVSGGSW
jgi:DNA repair protein RadC